MKGEKNGRLDSTVNETGIYLSRQTRQLEGTHQQQTTRPTDGRTADGWIYAPLDPSRGGGWREDPSGAGWEGPAWRWAACVVASVRSLV